MTAIDAASATLRLRGALMVAGAALCWSFGGLLQRVISADAWSTIFWRSIFAALFLFAYLLWRERGRGLAPFREAGWAGVAVGFCFGTASTMYVISLSLTQVANTLIVLSTAPFMAALLAWLMLGEQVRTRTWSAIAAAFAGIALMVIHSAAAGNALGDLLAFGPPLAVAIATVLIRRGRNVRMMPAAVLAAVFAMIFTLPFARPLEITPTDLPLLLLFGAGQLGVGMILFLNGARWIPAAEASLIALLEVILAPLWVWLLLNEEPSAAAFAGGGIVMIALILHALLDARDARSVNAPF
ncbi:MAG TPA: DMT family transporter [Alphaproteobacteria bacterium]|nr:DMT family transporter [Alphaproteobacteria bacterium]